jgi:hypothetical protein
LGRISAYNRDIAASSRPYYVIVIYFVVQRVLNRVSLFGAKFSDRTLGGLGVGDWRRWKNLKLAIALWGKLKYNFVRRDRDERRKLADLTGSWGNFVRRDRDERRKLADLTGSWGNFVLGLLAQMVQSTERRGFITQQMRR